LKAKMEEEKQAIFGGRVNTLGRRAKRRDLIPSLLYEEAERKKKWDQTTRPTFPCPAVQLSSFLAIRFSGGAGENHKMGIDYTVRTHFSFSKITYASQRSILLWNPLFVLHPRWTSGVLTENKKTIVCLFLKLFQ